MSATNKVGPEDGAPRRPAYCGPYCEGEEGEETSRLTEGAGAGVHGSSGEAPATQQGRSQLNL